MTLKKRRGHRRQNGDLIAGDGGVATNKAQSNHRSCFLRALLAIHSARDIARIERFVQK